MKPITLTGKYTNATIYAQTLEESCHKQIQSMINSPAFTKPVVIMPDTHAGMGSVVGFTMPIGDKLIPNTVGVDIGCGIYAYKVTGDRLNGDINWQEIDTIIRSVVPLGFSHRNVQSGGQELEKQLNEIEGRLGIQSKLRGLLIKLGIPLSKAISQLGTLGGGNHFIEFAQSKNDKSIWLLIHTGSRNVGKKTCEYWQERAIDHMAQLRDAISTCISETSSLDIFKTPADQCWIRGLQKEEYLQDMFIAQKFAHMNKHVIRDAILSALGLSFEDAVESVHNYIDSTDHVIRKGAIRANADERVVIPFNMRDGSILAVGKGNKDWNNSAPHGAGRIMSRSQAKQQISLQDFSDSMKDVWSSSVCAETLDEAPFAYKDAHEIESLIKDTATVIDYLIPLYNLKDDSKLIRKKRK